MLILLLNQAAASSSYTLTAEAGSVSLSGGAATLKVGRRLIADTGALTVTGSAAAFKRDYRLSAQAEVIVITGSDATLNYSGAAVPQPEVGGSWTWVDGRQRPLDHYTLAAEAGRIRITGYAADLRKGISPEWLRRRRLATAALLLAA